MTDRKAIQYDLEQRGVGEDFADAMAEHLEKVADRLLPEVYDAVLTGVTLAFAEHRRGMEALRRTAKDLDEIQHLLSAFGDELQKLDEALETLAAYTLRMRSQSDTPERTLH